MIEIYNKNNLNFDSNGDITLTPLSCIYKSDLNGVKTVELEHEIDDIGRWKYIIEDSVLAISRDSSKQLYRIYNTIKNLDSIIAYARPIAYDLIDKILLDVRPTNCNGQDALNSILSNTRFTGYSNITKLNTAYFVKKNIIEALFSNDENSFLNRWGGEFLFDNFDIYINDKIGLDRGIRVEFGYNLSGIEEDINIDEVVTRIIPVGYDGIMLAGSTPWVDSPNINKYVNVKERVIEFDDVKVKENTNDEEGFNTIEEARTELINRCRKLYENGIDKPLVNYKINMIDLKNTTAYEVYKVLEEINEGDTVTCNVSNLDIDVKARCIKLERNELTGELISFELGDFEENYFNSMSDVSSRVEKIFNKNGTVKGESLEGTINALNTIFKAQRDIAQKQNIRAMLFEDRITDSPTFGAMCLGTMGFEIASSYKPGTTEWDFRTFGTGRGFLADCIVAGTLKAIVLESLDGSCRIDLGSGIINIAKGIIRGLNSSWNLDTGIFTSSSTVAGKVRELILSQGGIYSNHTLWLESKEAIIARIDDGSGLTKGFTASSEATNVSGQRVFISSADAMQVIADCKWNGNLNISGTLTVNGKVIG